MSHYTDIGFNVKNNQEVVALFNKINSNKNYPPMIWDINIQENIILTMKKLGEIRYFSKLDNKKNKITEIGLSHNNENITKMRIININYDNKEGFPILQLEKDGIPFWFECPNVEIFNMENEKECDVKLSSFANNVKIKKANEEKNIQEEKFSLANECYISDWNGDPSVALIQGIIKGYKLEKNVLTNKLYYAIDIECLGLNMKMLVDKTLLNKKEIIIGDILCGEFWNTAILVADNHPDYF